MKQKLYYLLALTFLLLFGTGKNVVHAATETTVLTFSDGELTNATANYTENGTLDDGKYKLASSDNQAASKYVELILSSGTFKENDAISISYYAGNTSKTVKPGLFFGTKSGENFTSSLTLQAEETSNGSSSPASASLTITSAGNGTNVLRLTRYSGGTSLFITSLTITREVEDPSASSLSVTFSTDNIKSNGVGVGNVGGIISTATVGLSGSNVSWGNNITYSEITYGGVSTSNTTTADDKMTFTIYPKKGITFNPTKISFGAIRSGTNGGAMTLKVNNTTLTSTDVPGRNTSGKEEDGYKFSYDISNITTTKANPLIISIAMVGMTGTRGWGLADLVVEGTYTGTPEDGESYTVATSVNINGAGTVTQSPAGASLEEETKITFTAAANTGYAFVNWTDDNNQDVVLGTDATYTINSLSGNTAITANFKALTAVSFDKGDSGAYGEVPTAQYGDGSVNVTIPANKTLYKKGYTLKRWRNGNEIYTIGQAYQFSENTTLTPGFEQNSVSQLDFPEETTVTWQFGNGNNAPAYSGVESANVKQVTIGNETIDLGIQMPGGTNAGRNDEWLNTQGKGFVVPVSDGAIITAKVYYAGRNATFNGEEVVYDSDTHGNEGNVVFTYTYTGTDDAITVNVGNQFLSYISVKYPYVEKRLESDLTITSATEVTLTANEPTSQISANTSANVDLTYSSSNNLIATVDANGLITAVANGTATITVSQTGDAVYADDSKEITVTVNNGVIPSYTVDAILNNEEGSKLTSGEQVQNTAVSFGINTANERVAFDATDAVVKIAGKYHSDHGCTNLNITVNATGNMKFIIGNCTYNTGTATLKDAQDNTIKSVSLSGTGCWKGTHTDITTMFYEGEATTLTLSVPDYCPYIKVESVEDIAKYTVTFMNGNETVDTKPVCSDGKNTEPLGALPTPDYESNSQMFLGWYANTSDMGSKVAPNTVPTGNVTYNAIITAIPTATAGYYTPTNATELVAAVQYANQTSSANSPAKIFLKNGTYDLGSIAEIFQLTGSYVSIIGESLDGTVITNVPTQEGLGTATLLYNKGQYNYLQDLTLHNNYPYGNSTGRAASLKDEGNYTICNNVWLYSHQDTYYSHQNHSKFYFKGGKISGCVDYMCGQGRVYFDGVTLSNDNRGTTMTANSELYVFNNCTIENGGQTYNFGRAWSSTDGFGDPVCVFLNTTLMDNGSNLASTRWNLTGINTDYAVAGEYGTKNASGTDIITPASNNVTFTKKNTALNTILTAEQAAQYTTEYTLGNWATTAASDVVQATVSNVKLNGTTLSWTGTSDAYLIENNGEFVALTDETSYTVNGPGNYTVRAANGRGGFGEVAEIASEAITTNTFGNASHVAVKALDFSGVEGLKAYVATAANGAGITLAEVTAVPAGTAFVVQATEKSAQTYYIPTTTGEVNIGTNVFLGSNSATATAGNATYALSKSKGMFAKVKSGVTIPTGVAYVNITNGAKETLAFFFGETTGIAEAEAAEAQQGGVRKQLINGRLVIIKGDKQYNAAGGEF